MSVHPCSLLAVQGGYGYKYAEKIYAELQKKKKGSFELNPINIDAPEYRFRDGEIKPHITKNIRKRNCYFIHDSSLHPFEWFTQLALINYAMKFSSAQEIVDVMPYHLFARQDRKDESRVPISAKVVADVVGLYANRALTLDIHNPSIQGFYNVPFDGLEPDVTAIDFIRKDYKKLLGDVVVLGIVDEKNKKRNNALIVSTDTGGGKRAKRFAKLIGADFVEGYKYREHAGEVEKSKILGDVSGRRVLVMDDIVDSGNTLISINHALIEAGALEVNAYLTHGLFTKGLRNVTDHFNRFYIGDTRPLPLKPGEEIPSNIRIVKFAPLFAKAIYRTAEGMSLSELYSLNISV